VQRVVDIARVEHVIHRDRIAQGGERVGAGVEALVDADPRQLLRLGAVLVHVARVEQGVVRIRGDRRTVGADELADEVGTGGPPAFPGRARERARVRRVAGVAVDEEDVVADAFVQERGGDRYRGTGGGAVHADTGREAGRPDADVLGDALRQERHRDRDEPIDVLTTQTGVFDRLGRGFGGEAERRPVGPGTLVRRLAYANDGRLPAKAHSVSPAMV
jgi:hypothetical protein